MQLGHEFASTFQVFHCHTNVTICSGAWAARRASVTLHATRLKVTPSCVCKCASLSARVCSKHLQASACCVPLLYLTRSAAQTSLQLPLLHSARGGSASRSALPAGTQGAEVAATATPPVDICATAPLAATYVTVAAGVTVSRAVRSGDATALHHVRRVQLNRRHELAAASSPAACTFTEHKRTALNATVNLTRTVFALDLAGA
jgi:hypothetical protein